MNASKTNTDLRYLLIIGLRNDRLRREGDLNQFLAWRG